MITPVTVTPVVSLALVWPVMVSAMLTAMVTPLDGPRTDRRSPPLQWRLISGCIFLVFLPIFPLSSSPILSSFSFQSAGVSQPGSSRLPELSQDNHNLVVPTVLSYRIEQKNSRRLILTPALNITRATN